MPLRSSSAALADTANHLGDYKEMTDWQDEMSECAIVDPQFHHQYSNTHSEIIADKMLRLEGFLKRHGLVEKFYAEDAQGKRR